MAIISETNADSAPTPATNAADEGLRSRHAAVQPAAAVTPAPASPRISGSVGWRADANNMFVLVVLYALQGIPLGLVMGSMPFLLQAQMAAAPTPVPGIAASKLVFFSRRWFVMTCFMTHHHDLNRSRRNGAGHVHYPRNFLSRRLSVLAETVVEVYFHSVAFALRLCFSPL